MFFVRLKDFLGADYGQNLNSVSIYSAYFVKSKLSILRFCFDVHIKVRFGIWDFAAFFQKVRSGF